MFTHPTRLFMLLLFFSSASWPIVSLAVSASPKVIQLVEISSIAKNTLTLSWLPSSDDKTAHENLVYRVHLSKRADFLPDNTTLRFTKTGAVSATITHLKPASSYFAVVTATDEDGNVSWSNRLEGKTAASNPKRTSVKVHELSAGQLARSAKLFKTGDYVVSRENGGVLRKIDAAVHTGQSAPANHGSLNELFSELDFSSTIKLQNLPAESAATAKLSIKAPSPSQAATVTWTETGLTLSNSDAAQNAPLRTSRSLVLNGKLQTETGHTHS